MDFGELFKQLRIKRGLTLRQFCEQYTFDPGNISKLERGLLPAPQASDKLKAYAKALDLKSGTDEYLEFFDLAAASTKSFHVKNISDQELLNRLPVLFRTLDKKDLTEEKLERIIKILKEETDE
jgi:transcriptional regulator with XRE-family HTH domain